MPIYEFACNDCGRRLSVFQRQIGQDLSAVCPACKGPNLRRLVSQFAVMRSVDSAFDDSGLDGLGENDPQAVARWARRMSEEMGEDLAPDFKDDVSAVDPGDGYGGDFDDDL